MDFKFVPEAVNKGEMAGHVTMRTPTFKDKMHFYDSLSIPTDSEGLEKSKQLSGWKTLAMMAEMAEKYVVEVDLTRVADGHKFDSYAALDSDDDGHMIIQEIVAKLSSKMHLGKK